MRLIQLKVPRQNRQAVQEILEAEEIEYAVINTSGGGASDIFQFFLPRPAVEPIVERLHDVGVDEDFRVSLSAETIRSSNSEDLVDQFLYDGEYKDVIPREELGDKARDMLSNNFTYYFMTVLGTIVATSGLLLNSAAVVIGAMVLAPQLGAALKASVGITTNDRAMFFSGLLHQMIGLGFGLLGATAFATVIHSTDVVTISIADIMTISQISSRTSPGILSMVVAMTAGAAAVYNLATQDRPTGPLVGVMMSAALIPAAATAGIGIAWGSPRIVIGSLVLLAVNVASINLTGPLTLWSLGYRPAGWGNTTRLVQIRSLLPIIVLLFGVFLGAGFLLAQQVAYVNTVNTAVEATLDEDEYDDINLRSITARYSYLGALSEPPNVTIIIDRPTDTRYPGLAAALQRNISKATGVDVVVTVEYVDNRKNGSTDNNTTTTDGAFEVEREQIVSGVTSQRSCCPHLLRLGDRGRDLARRVASCDEYAPSIQHAPRKYMGCLSERAC